KNFRAHPRTIDDTALTPADFAKYNVVLFGDPGSNKWIAQMIAKLPLRWSKQTIVLGKQTFPAGENLPALVYPNPLNSSHYIVLNSGMTFIDREYNGDYSMSRLGDIAVLKLVKDGADLPEIAWAGLFDESWQLPKESK